MNRDTYPRIWKAVARIPRGRVSTYGVIARVAGMAGQARLVGYALHRLPEGAEVPWHRVVNSRGRISLPRASGSGSRQMRLLAAEGVRFRAGSIDLRAWGWPSREFPAVPQRGGRSDGGGASTRPRPRPRAH